MEKEFLTQEELRKYSHCLSDILCWLRGYIDGSQSNSGFLNQIQEELRELNIKLKNSIKGDF